MTSPCGEASLGTLLSVVTTSGGYENIDGGGTRGTVEKVNSYRSRR